MDRNERKLKESVVIAAGTALFVVACYFVQQMVGFDNMNPGGGATPKKFDEVIVDWPRFLGIGIISFAGILWWQMSKIEPSYLICSNCTETIEKGKESSTHCMKCGGQLEDLEGFYDRHPDKISR
jgi:hypothetical protein